MKFMMMWIVPVLCLLLITCKDPDVIKKLDAGLKVELKRRHETNQLDERISVVLRVNEEITDLHHQVLEAKGVKISANIGYIYTATLPAKQVYEVAKFRFVDYVQGQKKFRTFPSDSTNPTPRRN